MSNIEKSAFRPGQYVGYGGGTVWRISRHGRDYWAAIAQGRPDVFSARTLRDISAKLSAMSEGA
jgi:hypothetical protein